MGLRIRTNRSAAEASRNLEQTSHQLEKNMERMASGYRINQAADDAAGLAVSENLRARQRSMTQAQRNASDGVSIVQVAEASMGEVSNILIRLRELSVQAASDTIGNKERSFANKEYMELVEEINRIGHITEFNGVKLLEASNEQGPMERLSVHVGAGDGKNPNTDTIELDLTKMTLRAKEDLNLETGAAIGPLDLADPFERQTAAEKLSVLDTALLKVNTIRADLGAKQSRLESAISSLSIAQENVSATNSRIRDVDFAKETASFTQNRILQQAGVSILSQASSMPELALTLLR